MGRPQKEKNNYEKRFEQLRKEKRIDGNAGLLRKMYRDYYKGKLDVNTDINAWVTSQAPDFGKKIKGERSFTEMDKKAIERAFDMSWVDIVEPLPEKPEKNKEKKFKNRGLEYAAHIDDEWYYQELDDIKVIDGYNSVLLNYDEYGKTIIDYVIENKAEKGLKFLIDKGYLRCDGFLKFDGKIYRVEECSEKLWDWIISIDDSQIFLKALGEHNLFKFSFYREDEGEKFLEKIIGTKKILESLCKEREHLESKSKYMPSLLFEALKFSLKKNEQIIAQRIISAYTKFIENQIAAVRNESNQEKNSTFSVCNDHSVQSKIYDGNSLIMYAWNFSKLQEEVRGFKDQIEQLKIENVTKRLEVKNLSAMEYGDSFVKDGIYYIKRKPDVSLEALKYLTKEKGCKFLPTYIGEENGVTKVCAYRSDWHSVKFSELGEMLGEIHSLSQEKLGADRVYMYSRGFIHSMGFANGFGRMLSDGTKVIINWEICDIGTPIVDIIIAFLNYCKYAYSYYEESYRCFIEEKVKSYEELSVFLNAYPDKRIIENFGEKFNEELDKMLKDAIQGTQGKNDKEIEKLFIAKSFAEIYRNDLNLITKQGCDVEGDK